MVWVEDPCICPLCQGRCLDYGAGFYKCDECKIEFRRRPYNHQLFYLTFNYSKTKSGGPHSRDPEGSDWFNWAWAQVSEVIIGILGAKAPEEIQGAKR